MTTTIDTMPLYGGDLPNKEQEDSVFNTNTTDILEYVDEFGPSINTTVDQINTVGSEMETLASTATTKAGEASDSADEAAGYASAAQGVTQPNGYESARSYSEKAAATFASLPDGSINDSIVSDTTTFSSEKIASLIEIDVDEAATIVWDFDNQYYVIDNGDEYGKTAGSISEFANYTQTGTTYTTNAAGKVIPVSENRVRVGYEEGAPKGLSLRPAVEQIALYDTDFDTATWLKTGGLTVTPDNKPSPILGYLASTLTKTASTSQYIRQTIGAGTAGIHSTTYRVSADTLNECTILLTGDGASTLHARVDASLANGSWTDDSSTNLENVFVEKLSLGFYEISVVANLTTATNIQTYLYAGNNNDATAGSIIVASGEVVKGYPVGFIPTTATTVTQPANRFYRELGGDFNASTGTFIVDFEVLAGVSTGVKNIISVTDSESASGSNSVGIRLTNDIVELLDTSTVLDSFDLDLSSNELTRLNVAFSYDCISNVMGWSINGVDYGVFALGTDLDTASFLKLATDASASECIVTVHSHDYIPQYFPSSQLTQLTGGV